jgi:ADP-heptose:LPS heptosyltransferase
MVSGGLGDCLLLSPFFRYFRSSGFFSRIICAVPEKAVELFDMNPNIDCIIPCKGRELYLWGIPEKKCSVFSPYVDVSCPKTLGAGMDIDAKPLHNFNLEDTGVVRQLADYYGIPLKDESLEIFTTEDDEQRADEILQCMPPPFVFINSKSTNKQKEYPIQNWKRVATLLKGYATMVQFADHSEPLDGIEKIQPTPGIRTSAAIFKRMSCVLTVDSFAHHLACSVGVPAVVLFGLSNPRAFGHKQNINLRSDTCTPCADTARQMECNRSHCMETISPESIAEATIAVLRNQTMKNNTKAIL